MITHPGNQITIQQSRELLEKRFWMTPDIMKYFGISIRTANELKKKAIDKYDGSVYGSHVKVKVSSLMTAAGTSFEKERSEVGLSPISETESSANGVQ
jgi:hypothetical protein